MLYYEINDKDLRIYDSYKVSKHDFQKELSRIRYREPGFAVWGRSLKGMRKEWATHNLLYACHLFRSRTKDLDINYPQSIWEFIAYGIAGTIAWIFIK